MAGTQSIRRAVALLEAFGDDRPAWGVSDLAEAVELNRTTVYRLLTALESVEYVARDPATDTYRLGSGLIALGARAQRCLLYTSDPADERSSVDLGGRRIIQKKKTTSTLPTSDITIRTHISEHTKNTTSRA